MKSQSILIMTAAISFFSVTSCMKKPGACVDNVTKSGSVGQSISFDGSCSTNAHHYLWDFGDGGTGHEAVVNHAYNSAGTYNAKLTAKSKNSKKEDIKTVTVTIN